MLIPGLTPLLIPVCPSPGGNGIHGWRNHCIIVGECLHLGFLIHSEECYDLLIARIRMQFVRHHAVVVKISRSPDFLEVA